MYISERIREIWNSLTSDKKRLTDAVLHTFAKKIVGDTIADEFFKKPDANLKKASENELAKLLLLLEAVKLMSQQDVQRAFASPSSVLHPYLSEALSSIVTTEPQALTAYTEIQSSPTEDRNLAEASYAEAYFNWVEKTSDHLKEVRSILRIVSFNEFSVIWDKPVATTYLATHHKIKLQRHADLRRVFVYDNNYFLNAELLRRLLIEVSVQSEIGIDVRVCSYPQLREKGEGYYYTLEAFGIYDRSCLAILIPHPKEPLVSFIHKHQSIKDAIDVYDNIYDSAEPASVWKGKHKKALSNDDEQLMSYRVREIIKRSRTITLF